MRPDRQLTTRPPAPPAGLCETCAHRRLVPNTRGSVFSLCERSRTDSAYPRYPRLPVLECVGYERAVNARLDALADADLASRERAWR